MKLRVRGRSHSQPTFQSGPIFLYAKDKRDLLCLVLNHDLDEVFRSAVPSLPPAGSVERRLRCLLCPDLRVLLP